MYNHPLSLPSDDLTQPSRLALEKMSQVGADYCIIRKEHIHDKWVLTEILCVKEPVRLKDQRQMWLYRQGEQTLLPCLAIPEAWSGNEFGVNAAQPSYTKRAVRPVREAA